MRTSRVMKNLYPFRTRPPIGPVYFNMYIIIKFWYFRILNILLMSWYFDLYLLFKIFKYINNFFEIILFYYLYYNLNLEKINIFNKKNNFIKWMIAGRKYPNSIWICLKRVWILIQHSRLNLEQDIKID